MLDPYALVEIGRASVATVWLPIAIWTLLASACEAALRLTRAHASVGVRVRSALLLGLPLALLVPALLSALAPDAVTAVASLRPAPLVLPEITVGLAPAEASPSVPLGWALLGLATLALAIAAGAGVLRWASSLLHLRRLRSGLGPAPEALQHQLDAARAESGLQTPVEVALCGPGTAPFTFGWRRPVVAVPPTLDGEPLRLALDHELAHVRHHDFLWNGLDRGAAALGTAHPLVHTLARQAALGREQLADASVLAARPDQRRAYADLLLSFASLPAPRLALGATPGSSLLQTRITAMNRTFSPTRLRQLAAAGRGLALVALALLLGTAAAFAVPDAPPAVAPPDPAASLDDAHQAGKLEGRVTDAETGEGIMMANLSVVDTDIGAATTPSGEYVLDGPDGAYSLRVTARGYDPEVVQVDAGQRQLDVALQPADGEENARQREQIRAVRERMEAQREQMEAMRDRRGDDGIYEVVSTAPRLIGGLQGLQDRVVYPAAAKADGIQGKVFVQFIVNEQGEVDDPQVARSPSPLLSEAALDATRASRFEPGRTDDGTAVKVRFSLPINFVLPGASSSSGAAPPADRNNGAPVPDVFEIVEDPPVLIGGLEALQQTVVYPAEARADGVEGRVFVMFVVDEEGRVTEPQVMRSPDPRLSEAALDAVRAVRFEPGTQRGQAVKVRYSLPINFVLPSGGDGRDRGANSSSDGSLIEQGLTYAGVQLSLLQNEDAIRGMLSQLATRLGEGTGTGEMEATYTLQPDGKFNDVTVVKGTGALTQNFAQIVDRMVLAEGRRPPTPRSGMFRVMYSSR